VSLPLEDIESFLKEFQLGLDNKRHFDGLNCCDPSIDLLAFDAGNGYACQVHIDSYCFGHLGDQDLHLNCIAKFTLHRPYDFLTSTESQPVRESIKAKCIRSIEDAMDKFVYGLVVKRKGGPIFRQ
jgi:hypothetical protein